ncbi:MAG: signal peptidase I [Verrucomicrobiota bacterium]
MTFHWFISGTVRQADAMVKHVRKLLNHQRDVLAPKSVEEMEKALGDVESAIRAKADKAALQKQMEGLEAATGKWIKPYPNAAWRENVEVLLVALAVALGIRTFFLQPFKIPTGSMQPTLFGVNSLPDFTRPMRSRAEVDEQNRLRDEMKIPTGLERVKQWFQGSSYIHIVAETDGQLESVGAPLRLLIFNIKQTVRFGGREYTLWFPPDYGAPTLDQRAGVRIGQTFRKGEDVIKMRVNAGDHLFVDRMSYNFVPPSRGQIVVFETKGIPEERRENPPYWSIPADQFYIKRLVGLSGESIRIGDDRHLVINGRRLDAMVPHFENVYGFDPKTPPHDSIFSGHVNEKISGQLVPLFRDGSMTYKIGEGNVMVMGDNSMNSLDSRFWGDFPETAIIGRAFSVYWPITDRFGWACIAH